MDEKGYAFTPLAFLLFIPVIIIALSYGSIINELNDLSVIAIGGDVTYNTATNIYTSMEKGAADAGRNGAYNATRTVIDDRTFMTDSRSYITENIRNNMNDYVISACQKLEVETGRSIYINNIKVTESTEKVFKPGDVTISQEDPFGFYVHIAGGIPVKVEQNDTNQVFTGYTPPITVYISIEGLEDPYIWLNSKNRVSTIIYQYPHYTKDASGTPDYHFHNSKDGNGLHYLWECLNGTGNPSEIYPRPYYFIDPQGLSFFDRLENKTTSNSDSKTRMSTFILGDPLQEDHGTTAISRLDHEYFAGVAGTPVLVDKTTTMKEPDIGAGVLTFYLSDTYKNYLDLMDINVPYKF